MSTAKVQKNDDVICNILDRFILYNFFLRVKIILIYLTEFFLKYMNILISAEKNVFNKPLSIYIYIYQYLMLVFFHGKST